MRYQQEAQVEVIMPPNSDKRAILICRDKKQQIWVWDLDGNARKYKDRMATGFDFEGLWFDFYGEDIGLLTRVGSRVSL
jgi:hypothetical protein